MSEGQGSGDAADPFKQLGDIFKKIGIPMQQPQRQQPQQPQPKPPRRSRYHRLAWWIKDNYGTQFKDGSMTADVQKQLESIYKQLEAKGFEGSLFDKESIVKGWRAYIERRQYGDLVKVSDPVEIPAEKITCPQCKKPTAPGKFCEMCGAPLDKKSCPSCGARNTLTAKFCNNCGNKLD